MTRTDLIALIARVEASTGPDRELDERIHSARGFCVHPWSARVREGAQSDTGFSCSLCGADSWGNKGKNGERLYDAPPHYTGIVDAAMTLASNWIIEALGDMVANGMPGAMLLLSTDPIKHASGIGYGTRESGCLARALTAAALRAMLASMGDDA
jgi:hypothetical protein